MGYCIKVENLSKKYTLGHQKKLGGQSFKDALSQKTKNFFSSGPKQANNSKVREEFTALDDVSFTIDKGDRVGIIGRNGAGKSTLLKILSRVVEPDKGQIHISGRIASLLEVGTGFHPELTGRENIFLNGTILGMSRSEIKSKFDEIIAFAEIERFLDTPVKRYSSGMYVKLAFAVAAHLDPEILILDEVLAVGDAQFQKKCLGKMEDVSKNEGRTIVFVSHNMHAIQKLCTKGILLAHGKLIMDGPINSTVEAYLEIGDLAKAEYTIPLPENSAELPGYAYKARIEDLNGNLLNDISIGTPWQLRVFYKLTKKTDHFIIGMGTITAHDLSLRTSWSKPMDFDSGDYEAVFINDDIILTTGTYTLIIGLSQNESTFHYIDNLIKIKISEVSSLIENKQIVNTHNGLIINPMKIIIS
jgi:lipopolysaccharide transport system ATP-binding protein